MFGGNHDTYAELEQGRGDALENGGAIFNEPYDLCLDLTNQ